MKFSDIQPQMTVRIGPAPATDAAPYANEDSGDRRYVNQAAAGRLGRVEDVHAASGTALVYSLSEDLVGEEFMQWIHAGHLSPATAEPSPATQAAFNDIVGGAELDDLRELGDQLDTGRVAEAASATDLSGVDNTGGLVPLPFPLGELHVTNQPTEGEYSVYPPAADDHVAYLDMDDDQLDLFFREQNCQTHGHEAAFTISVNGEAVLMVPSLALQLAKYITDRVQRIVDRGEVPE